MSKLDCPDDFPKENCRFLAFEKKKTGYGPTDQPSDGQTHPRIGMDLYKKTAQPEPEPLSIGAYFVTEGLIAFV